MPGTEERHSFRWHFSAASHSPLSALASLTSGIDLTIFDPTHAQPTQIASYRSSRPGGVQRPLSLNGGRVAQRGQSRRPLLADNHLASGINAVNLEDRLGNVEIDCRYRL